MAALIFMVTKIVGAVADLGIGTQHSDVSDELSKHVMVSIRLNFVLNMTEAGSFETSLICYRSTRIRSTAAVYDKSIIVLHVLFIESNRMVWYSNEAVVL
jgi:hypothetical protein